MYIAWPAVHPVETLAVTRFKTYWDLLIFIYVFPNVFILVDIRVFEVLFPEFPWIEHLGLCGIFV